MDEIMSAAVLGRARWNGWRQVALTGACVLVCATPARAQLLSDPTQPPPESALQQGGAVAAAPAATGPRLQSVLIGTRGREVAVIDGQTVRRGEKFNGALLVKVGKNQVVLRRAGETQILTLFPGETGDKPAPLKR